MILRSLVVALLLVLLGLSPSFGQSGPTSLADANQAASDTIASLEQLKNRCGDAAQDGIARGRQSLSQLVNFRKGLAVSGFMNDAEFAPIRSLDQKIARIDRMLQDLIKKCPKSEGLPNDVHDNWLGHMRVVGALLRQPCVEAAYKKQVLDNTQAEIEWLLKYAKTWGTKAAEMEARADADRLLELYQKLKAMPDCPPAGETVCPGKEPSLDETPEARRFRRIAALKIELDTVQSKLRSLKLQKRRRERKAPHCRIQAERCPERSRCTQGRGDARGTRNPEGFRPGEGGGRREK